MVVSPRGCCDRRNGAYAVTMLAGEGETKLPSGNHILGPAAKATQSIGADAETKIDGITLKADLISLCASPVSHFLMGRKQ